ncbi:unnamed protein product [Caenorhabditis brenneri]
MSTLSKFPLFKLPWLAIKEVISNMEFGTLETEVPEEEKNQTFTISVGGLELKSLVVSNEFITYTNGELRKSVKPGIEYLTQLFSCPLPRIHIFSDGMKKPILSSLFGFGDCYGGIIIHGEEEIENEELYCIFDKYTFKEIVIGIPLKEDFSSDVTLWKHPNEMLICNAHWVTGRMLSGIKCSFMTLFGCGQLKAIDCRLFVDRWMNSNDVDFHFLEFRWRSDYPEELNYDYFGGLELQKFDPKSRSYAYCYCKKGYAMDVSIGRDFKRKDGLLATIRLVNKCFIFCVWHERFPNLEGREVYTYY